MIRRRADVAPGPTPDDDEAEERRLDLERMLMDADRMMMQMVQLALSLIGFGFSINAFFNEVASRGAVVGAGLTARRLGLALLVIGLLFLCMGIWSQGRYRLELTRRYRAAGAAVAGHALLDGRGTPTFVIAFLLLIVGLGALASITLRQLF